MQFRNRFGHGFVHGTQRDGLRRRRRGRSETTSWPRPPGATALDASEPPNDELRERVGHLVISSQIGRDMMPRGERFAMASPAWTRHPPLSMEQFPRVL